MAFLVIDGFDSYVSAGDDTSYGLASGWAVGNGSRFSTGPGTLGGNRVSVYGNATFGAAFRLFPATSTISFGMCVNVATVGSVNSVESPIAFGYANGGGLSSSTLKQVCLQFLPGGAIQVSRNASSSAVGTILATSAAGVLVGGVDCYLEGEIVFSDTVGRVKLVANGVTVIDTTANLDTVVSGAFCDHIMLRGYSSSTNTDLRFDDVWVNDSPTIPAGGPFRVERLRPTSDGTTLDWTPSTGTAHWSLLDDDAAGSTDSISSSTVGAVDELGLANLSAAPATIAAVQVSAFARKDATKARAIALGVKSGATTSDGPDFTLLTGSRRFDRIIETDPATSAPWSAAGVNGLTARVKLSV